MGLKIILDCDSVLAHTMKHVLNLYNREYDLQYTIEDITEYDLPKVQKKDTDMSKYFMQKGFFYELEEVDGAKKYVEKLCDDGHDLIVATASSVYGYEDKFRWISRHFPCIPEKNIIFVYRKDLLSGDIMLDDGMHNIETSICTYPIVFDRPWNRKADKRFERIFSWREFYELVCNVHKRNQRNDKGYITKNMQNTLEEN